MHAVPSVELQYCKFDSEQMSTSAFNGINDVFRMQNQHACVSRSIRLDETRSRYIIALNYTTLPCIGTCRAVWVPRQDLASSHLMHNRRKCILSLHCMLYVHLCMHIYNMLVTTCLHVQSSWYEYAWFKLTRGCRCLCYHGKCGCVINYHYIMSIPACVSIACTIP